MKKLITFGLLVGLILSVGCISQNQPPQETVTCNPPYIKVGNSCCLDQNGNGICDKDEVSEMQNRVEQDIADTEFNELPSSGGVIIKNGRGMVGGFNNRETINYVGDLTLLVGGDSNIVTISKKTNLIKLTLGGSNNVVRLSSSHDSVEIIKGGYNNKIEYYD